MQPYYCAIEELPGLKSTDIKLLKINGIIGTKELIEQTSTIQKRQLLANRLQLKIEYVNKWLALADLSRIPSVNHRYCGLVLHSGIASVSQLAETPIGRLHQQVLRLSVATTRRKDLSPSVEIVRQWIKEAKLLVESSKIKIGKKKAR
ncbi:DUF4332 domain-containing protein [Myxosarcina sp. GI1]|uniref:DUF4332 domain-containing protein n=1 Tax=Myxosarcina sp. GI1 TaxID=1541065 RepID=UPI00056C32D5|nr:DUF4332 domain-containing protein [Myxosarcina sp. GI1]